MSGELGRASYELDADLGPLRRNVKQSRAEVSDFERVLDSLGAIADIAAEQLKQIKITPRQGAESRTSAQGILEGVRGISDESRIAAREIDKVRITDRQAAESDIAGDVIDRKLKDITDNANEARRSLESVRLAGAAAGGAGSRNPGSGVGPFGSGFGRIGVLGAAIGGGVLTGPAAAPALVGLLAATPALAGAAAGSLGVLALAFDGVGKAISGDKKAFDGLGPSAQAFVQTVRSLDGWFDKLKQTAAGSLFPGLAAGLKAALSPGTLNAVTQAVSLLGHALGAAGEDWGRYFGSAAFQQSFGPLMQSAARTIGNLAGAMLHLFDALGVLARAAVPLTDWITRGIAAGSQMVDTWLHAKEATGQLAGAMNEAKTSLQLVGGLIASLFRAVGSLGAALYPVSKVAVKDLTDGLNALAGIIDRNRQTIRDIVSGALAALVSTVKALTPIVTALVHALEAVAHAVGGWKTAFEIILGGFLAVKVVKLGGAFVDMAGSIAAVGPKIAKMGVAADAAVGEVGVLRGALLGLGAPEVIAAIAAAGAAFAAYVFLRSQAGDIVSQTGPNFTTSDGKTYGLGAGRVAGTYTGPGSGVNPFEGIAGNNSPRDAMRGAAAAAVKIGGTVGGPGDFADESSWLKIALTKLAGKYGQVSLDSGYRSETSQDALWDASVKAGHPGFMPGGNPIARPANRGGAGSDHTRGTAADGKILYKGQWVPLSALPTAILQQYGLTTVPGDVGHVQLINQPFTGGDTTSPFGADPAFTKNLGPKTKKPPKPPLIPNMISDLLNKASANASQSKQLGNVGGTAKRYLENELGDLGAADAALHKLVPKTARERQQISAKETEVENKIRDVHTLIKNAIFATGDAILPAALKSKLTALQTKFKADSLYSATLTGQAAEAYAATLHDDITGQADVLTQEAAQLKTKLAAASGKQKAAIQKELTKVTGQLQTVQEQVVQTLQGAVQTLQQHVATQFGKVQAQLFTALGKKFFQNGLLTPLEQQLADMQAQDTTAGLKDALQQAQAQKAADVAANSAAIADAADVYNTAFARLDLAKNTADTPASSIEQFRDALNAAKQQLDALSDPGKSAQQLSLDDKAIAQAQRSIDENDLAIRATAERKQADLDYAAAQIALTDKLDTLADAFQNGAGTISDLTTLAADFGIQIDGVNVPALANLSTESGKLKDAFKALKDYIYTITGTRPSDATDPPPPAAGGSSNQFGTIDPGLAAALGIAVSPSAPDALGRYIAGHAIGMAAGGVGRAKMPTLFYSNGDEDFAFSGEGRSFADRVGSGGGGVTLMVGPVYGAIDQSVARQWAAPLKSELDRLIKI